MIKGPKIRFVFLLLLMAAGAMAQPDDQQMRDAMKALELRKGALERQLETAPQQYVESMLKWSEDIGRLADRYKVNPASNGLRGEAVSTLMQTADFVRRRLHDPKRAIFIYGLAAAQQRLAYPTMSAGSMDEQIADIYEFELNDRAAALKIFKSMRDRNAAAPAQERADYAAWDRWKRRWIDAEIAYLEHGQRFKGPVRWTDLGGISQQLFFGMGLVTTNGSIRDAALNPYEEVPAVLPETTRQILATLPPSHSTFLRTWLFAAHLPSRELDEWLDRNDPAGFWKASFLTAAAIVDRDIEKEAAQKRRDLFSGMVRLPDGNRTSLALLAREYAKAHPLPTPMK